ncbi:hypothetical protein B0O99DRAFT_601175 [Bisporella sp. PMI_857]|nr:hypothetical protein B0O99DRAFT_601175 [Bisporella sp. PMI_857]
MDQANDTESGGVALVVATYITTISYNLGGQPVTATRCNIWLKSDAVAGGLDPNWTERPYMAECVDPRRYLCMTQTGVLPLPGTCGTDWIGMYAQSAAAPPPDGTGAGGATRWDGCAKQASALELYLCRADDGTLFYTVTGCVASID